MKCILNAFHENSFGVIKNMKNGVAVSYSTRPPIAVSVRPPAKHSISFAFTQTSNAFPLNVEEGKWRFVEVLFHFVWRHNRDRADWQVPHTYTCSAHVLVRTEYASITSAVLCVPPAAVHYAFCVREFQLHMPLYADAATWKTTCARVCSSRTSQKHRCKRKYVWELGRHRSMYH